MADTELSEQNVGDILRTIRQVGPEVASMIWGSPGIGKTEATKQMFKDHEIVLVLAGCSEPTDISGVPHPYVNKEGINVATDVLVPLWAYNASEFAPKEHQGPMVIFFDDIVTGHEQTQAACFKVFGEKRVGNLPLRDNVYVIGAGNRVEDKSAAFEMPLALANRMKHYYAKVDVDAWVAWGLTEEANMHPLTVAFIRANGPALNRFDEMLKTSTSEKAFPTPRTWEMLSKTMWRINPAGGVEGDWLYRSAVGCIGAGTGIEFSTFAKTTSTLVRPDEIVKNPKTARVPDKREIDVLYATITSLEYYINQKKHYKHWKDALTYVLRPEMEPEYGLLIAKMATTIAFNKLSEKDRIKAAQTDEFQEMYKRWGTYLANPDS